MSWSSVRTLAWESCTETRFLNTMSRPNSCSRALSGFRKRFPRVDFSRAPASPKEYVSKRSE